MIAGFCWLLVLASLPVGGLIWFFAADRDREVQSQADLRLILGWRDLEPASDSAGER
jgi:hypothetical protein